MKTILLVDDEPVVLKIAELALQRSGYAVLASGDPQQAISLFESSKTEIDLLVTDVVMPGIEGPELAERLVQMKPKLPILLISGIVTERDLTWKGKSKVAFTFLRKPFQPSALVEKVRQALGEAPAPERVRRVSGEA